MTHRLTDPFIAGLIAFFLTVLQHSLAEKGIGVPSQASMPVRVSRKDLRQMRYKLDSLRNLNKSTAIATGSLVVVNASYLLRVHIKKSLKQDHTHSSFIFFLSACCVSSEKKFYNGGRHVKRNLCDRYMSVNFKIL